MDKKVYAQYSSFHLEPESVGYRLRLGTYQGNAGDSLSSHNGKQFTTLDRDKDAFSGKKCPKTVCATALYCVLQCESLHVVVQLTRLIFFMPKQGLGPTYSANTIVYKVQFFGLQRSLSLSLAQISLA